MSVFPTSLRQPWKDMVCAFNEACVHHKQPNSPGHAVAKRFEDDGSMEPVPLEFVEKQILAVTINNAFVQPGNPPLIHSYCEMYATRGLMTNVCPFMEHLLPWTVYHSLLQLADYLYGVDIVHETVDAPTIYLVPPYLPHYGHWLTEGIPLLVVLRPWYCFVCHRAHSGCCWPINTSSKIDTIMPREYCFLAKSEYQNYQSICKVP